MGEKLKKGVWNVNSQDFPSNKPIQEKLRFLVKYAILASSSHNSQPWQFKIDDGYIDVSYSEDRWLNIADKNKRELYISIGCAVENLCIAAKNFGLNYQINYTDNKEKTKILRIKIDENNRKPQNKNSKLFQEITNRYTDHRPFKNKEISNCILDKLQGYIYEDKVGVCLVKNSGERNEISELQMLADEKLMKDPEYREELGDWIGKGVLGSSWPMARIGEIAVRYLDLGSREGKKNSKLIQTSPVLVILHTGKDNLKSQVKTGRVFERISLFATYKDISIHPISQILEHPQTRDKLTNLLDLNNRSPQHLFRLGYTNKKQKHTPRWPIEKFLLDQ